MHCIKLSWMYSSGKKLLWEQNVQFFKQFSPCVIKLASKPRIVNLLFRHHLSLKFCTASYKFFRNLAEKNLSRFSFIFSPQAGSAVLVPFLTGGFRNWLDNLQGWKLQSMPSPLQPLSSVLYTEMCISRVKGTLSCFLWKSFERRKKD